MDSTATRDDNHLKYEHAAKCLNTKCDNPINITWKENLILVKKPEREVEETNGDQNGGICEQNDGISDQNGGISEQNGGICEENGGICEQSGDINDIITCNECGTKYPEENVDNFKKNMEFSELHLANMKESSVASINNFYLQTNPDVDICKFCLEKQEGVLHPLNVLYAQTLDNAFDALIQVQLWEQACMYAEKLLPCFRFYYGNYHPLVGLLHMKYGKILLYKMDLPNALYQFKCAEKIIKITHGEKHTLYKDHLLPAIDQAIIEST